MNENDLQIRERTLGNITVLEMSGSIHIETHDDLALALDRLRNLGRTRVLINLAEVNYIDSRGLFYLINFSKESSRYTSGGVRVLLSQSPESLARKIFETAHLERIMPVYFDFDKAMVDFESSGEGLSGEKNSVLPTFDFSSSG